MKQSSPTSISPPHHQIPSKWVPKYALNNPTKAETTSNINLIQVKNQKFAKSD